MFSWRVNNANNNVLKLGLKIHYDKVKTANDDGCVKANYIPVKDKAKQKIYTGMNKIIKAKQNLVQKN